MPLLDFDGLLYFYDKLKAKFSSKKETHSVVGNAATPVISGSTNDSGVSIEKGEYFTVNDGVNDGLYSATQNIDPDVAWSGKSSVVQNNGGINAVNKNIQSEIKDINNDISGYKTISDETKMATFSDANNSTLIKQLLFNIYPKQDKHEQDEPYASSANLLNWDYRVISIGSGESKGYSGISTAAGQYTFSCYVTREQNDSKYYSGYVRILSSSEDYAEVARLDLTNPSIEDVRKSISFTLPANTLLTITFYGTSEGNKGLNVYNIQVEEGSVVTPYKLHSNICPITGWTKAKIYNAKKNLFDNDVNDISLIADYTSSPNKFYAYKLNYPNGRYTISCSVKDPENPPNGHISLYTMNKIKGTFSVYQDLYFNHATQTITFNLNTPAILGTSNSLTTEQQVKDIFSALNIQIEKGNSSSSFEEPDYSYELSWSSLAGTIYGGVLDCVNGKLTSTYGYIASYNGETLPGKWISDRDAYAEGTSPSTGAEVAYELETPVVYDIDPIEVPLHEEENNIWTDCGNVAYLEYRNPSNIYDTIETKADINNAAFTGTMTLNNVPVATADNAVVVGEQALTSAQQKQVRTNISAVQNIILDSTYNTWAKIYNVFSTMETTAVIFIHAIPMGIISGATRNGWFSGTAYNTGNAVSCVGKGPSNELFTWYCNNYTSESAGSYSEKTPTADITSLNSMISDVIGINNAISGNTQAAILTNIDNLVSVKGHAYFTMTNETAEIAGLDRYAVGCLLMAYSSTVRVIVAFRFGGQQMSTLAKSTTWATTWKSITLS